VMSDVPQKRCPSCPEGQQWHPATTEFWHRDKTCKDGLKSQCKVCKKAYESRTEVREHKRAYRKDYHKSHLTSYYRYPEKREYYRAQQKAYRQHPEIRERIYAQNRAYSHRPEVREHLTNKQRHRRARKETILGTHTIQQIQDLLKRQKHKCYYCQQRFKKVKGKYIYHIDHTFPVNRVAGTNIPANDISYLVLACPGCNLSKKDKFPWEWPEGGRLL
jgi:HNH endonuclease